MKWLLLFYLFASVGRRASGGAVYDQGCPEGTELHGSSCIRIESAEGTEEKFESTKDNRSTSLVDAECLVGSKWESNCHSCECLETGVAKCVKQDNCVNKNGQEKPIRCKPRSNFRRDCNTCVCLENGNRLCTLMECYNRQVQKREALPSGNQCLPGSSWKSQCNACTCNDKGLPICTIAACPGQENEPVKQCAPNTRWRNSCNNCWCTSTGVGLCTLIGCLSDAIQKKEVLPSGVQCLPGSSWKSQCNTCSCNDKGFPVCTTAVCEGQQNEAVKQCAPNTRWENECNTCWCTSNGVTMCTRVECSGLTSNIQKREAIPSGVQCLPGSTWKSQCNTCSCDDKGLPVCTSAVCEGQENEPVKQCAPDREDRWKNECNTCWCSSTGVTLCTKMECVTTTIRKREAIPSGVQCLPGSTWKSQCNTCSCNDKGLPVCTSAVCEGQENEPVKQCAPDREDRWKNDCNTCWCSSTGVTLCTKMECVTTTIRKREALPSGNRCLPGSSWKSQCNTCNCNDKGLPVCTTAVCEGQENEPVKKCDPDREDRWMKECNFCWCTSTAVTMCTIRECNSTTIQKSEALPSGVQCLPGSSWKSQCNTCNCNDKGLPVCTTAVCEGQENEPVKQCAPDREDRWKNECNTCWCSSTGVTLCTKMECVSTTTPKSAALPSGVLCLPGSSWKSQCNTCSCNDKGLPVCTIAVCKGQENEPVKKCDPDREDRWMKECNFCWCTSTGVTMCTVRKCNSTTIQKSEALPSGVQCLPGSSWKSQCNTCNCNDKGLPVCTTAVCEGQENEAVKQCAPDRKDRWKNDCNTCWCSSTGVTLCTRMGCVSTTTPKSAALPSGVLCLPGSSWKSQCNTCNCNDKGFPICTDAVCKGEENEDVKQCAPDTRWIDKCNDCWCSSTGVAMCTNKGCFSITDYGNEGQKNSDVKSVTNPKLFSNNVVPHKQKRSSRCRPSEIFQLECNTCICSQTGESYRCTQKECFDDDDKNSDVDVFTVNNEEDHMERHSICKPLDTFYVSCNACHCNRFGTDYTCTNKPCPLPKDVEVFHELKVTKSSKNTTKAVVCVANRMFIKDCNTCWCNDDGTSFYCTRRVCVPLMPDEIETEDSAPEKLREIKKECRPDEVFELDCNVCRCNPDGKSFSCTRRACIEEDKKNLTLSRKTRGAQELPKACQPGQEFRLDCNKCLCDNEGQNFSCTRIDCSAVNNNHHDRSIRDVAQKKSSKCVPGTVFNQDCNVCRCTDEGHHATCTVNRCHADDEESKDAEQDPGFRCKAGEQFTRNCNDCTCSADGKSIFCTIRLCDDETTPDI